MYEDVWTLSTAISLSVYSPRPAEWKTGLLIPSGRTVRGAVLGREQIVGIKKWVGPSNRVC